MMWTEKDNALERTFVFHGFSQAFAFMVRVAMLAEKLNHHPEWSNVWNRVTIRLQTHEAGNRITKKDLELARAIDVIWSESINA